MPHYGFNLQWMYHYVPGKLPAEPDHKALTWIAKQGFNFIRIPTNYWFWTRDWQYTNPDETIIGYIDRYIAACREYGLHVSLNLHRAPGYCINGNDLERHNLWLDAEAQAGFVWLWEYFAQRYKGIPASQLSFDLLNEPPNVDQYGLTRLNHAAIMRRTVAAIRAIDPQRAIVIDGLGGGHLAMPELADLDVTHSGRGYQPMAVSHYQASWWDGHEGLAAPTYPVTWHNHYWDRAGLVEFYQPWRDVQARNVAIHIGEFGCYNRTPNDVALRWFRDLLSVYQEFGWGFGLWEFEGAFGIINHGRPHARYEVVDGYSVDRDLLDLLLAARIPEAPEGIE